MIGDEMLVTGQPLTQAYRDDAGFDLAVEGDHEVSPHGTANIPLASAIKSAMGTWTMLIGRSSAFRRGLLVNVGVIDEGYTGPLFAVVYNMTDEVVVVTNGERICQAIPMETFTRAIRPVSVLELPATERGHNGFGSSGQ